MKISVYIDRWLWPYLRHRSVYAGLLFAYFVGVASSIFLSPWKTLVEDASIMVMALIVIDSRSRYVVWRESLRRSRGSS